MATPLVTHCIRSVSKKRLIVKATLDGRPCYLLVDTGASVGILSYRIDGLKCGARVADDLVGVGGVMSVRRCMNQVELGGYLIGQFVVADIDKIIENIVYTTGIRIDGILSLTQMHLYSVEIYTGDNFIKI